MLSRTKLVAAFVAALVSASSYSATSVAHGVSDGRGGFTFFDSRLDNTNGTTPGFASLVSNYYNLGSDIEPYFINEISISTHINSRNPFVFDPAADIETYLSSHSRYDSGIYEEHTYIKEPVYDKNYNLIGQDVTIKSSHGSSLYSVSFDYERTEYYEQNGDYLVKKQETFTAGMGKWSIVEPHWTRIDENGISSVEYSDFRSGSDYQFPDTPKSGHGIFDFENSFIYFEGETTGRSFSSLLTDHRGVTGFFYASFGEESSFHFNWVDDRLITDISLAYSVPEPQTYTMLLAGFAVVGALTRRKRVKAAV